MSRFNTAKANMPTERGDYFPPDGEFVLTISRVQVIDTQKKGPAFIAEFEVTESKTHPDLVGTMKTWYQGLSDATIAMPALKGFGVACAGIDSSDKEQIKEKAKEIDELLDAAVDDGALNGEKVRLKTKGVKTKKDADFTVHIFSPYEAAA